MRGPQRIGGSSSRVWPSRLSPAAGSVACRAWSPPQRPPRWSPTSSRSIPGACRGFGAWAGCWTARSPSRVPGTPSASTRSSASCRASATWWAGSFPSTSSSKRRAWACRAGCSRAWDGTSRSTPWSGRCRSWAICSTSASRRTSGTLRCSTATCSGPWRCAARAGASPPCWWLGLLLLTAGAVAFAVLLVRLLSGLFQ